MPTLSSTIVQHQIASVRDVEEALARQVLHGGDLVTNLLELRAIEEAELTRLLAESCGLEPAPVGPLPAASDAVRRLVPEDIAVRHGIHPMEERDGVLRLAVSEPLAPEVEQDLSFSLGLDIAQLAAPSVRIRQALSRDYGAPLDRRTERALARLEGRPDPNPSSHPAPSTAARFEALPRPPSLPPLRTLELEQTPASGTATPITPPSPEVVAPTPSPVRAAAQEIPPPPRAPESAIPSAEPPAAQRKPAPAAMASLVRPSRKPSTRERRLGPYTAAMAEADLLAADAADDVLRALMDFASQYFEYSALFAVHGDIAEGRDASGPGADRARVNGIGVPLDLPSVLRATRDAGALQLARLSTSGLDAALAKDLERTPGAQVLLLPIIVRQRCVLILYGDHGKADVTLDRIGEVISFAPLVAASLERVIVRRKASRMPGEVTATGSLPPVRPRTKSKLPSAEERAAALAGALETPPPPDVGASARPSAPAPRAEPVLPSPRLAPRTPSTAPAPSTTSSGPSTRPAAPQPLSAAVRSDARAPISQPPRVITAPGAPASQPPRRPTPSKGVPRVASEVPATGGRRERRNTPVGLAGLPLVRRKHLANALPPVPPDPRDAEPIPLTRRTSSQAPAPEPPPDSGWEAPSPAAAEPASDGAPELSVGEAGDVEELERELEAEAEAARAKAEAERGVPLAPQSRSIAHSARSLRPARQSGSLQLPSVIVDLASDCHELVQRLIAGDSTAASELLEIGAPAAGALAAAFPGPITADLRRGAGDGPPRASECGPVLWTLMKLGEIAAPFVIVRTADQTPAVRAWATRLLGEIPTADGARAVVRRVLDTDPEVRRAALAAGRMLQTAGEMRHVIRGELMDIANDTTKSDDARVIAIEAVEDVRDARAVPALIHLLGDSSRAVVSGASHALVVLTRQDFGFDVASWKTWSDENSGRHRIEWLIDSLMHESADVRRAAGDELKSLTKEYFGYYDDLPRKERARAQTRYRDWWEAKGKARFR